MEWRVGVASLTTVFVMDMSKKFDPEMIELGHSNKEVTHMNEGKC